ncbi:hypothetical protein KJ359_008797 [Pestalotiopsis sp. 9143b]|nr:hypothetical protein KJ359_008797 [Pestalotiopsis sp. 9143b]
MVSSSSIIFASMAGAAARAALSDCFTLRGIDRNGTNLHYVSVSGNDATFELYTATFTANQSAATKFGIDPVSGALIDYAGDGRIASIQAGADYDYFIWERPTRLAALDREPLVCDLQGDDGVLACAAQSNANVHVIVSCTEVLIVAPELLGQIGLCYETTLVARAAEGCPLPATSVSSTILPTSTQHATAKYSVYKTTFAVHHHPWEPSSLTTSRHWNIHHSQVTPHRPQRPSVS